MASSGYATTIARNLNWARPCRFVGVSLAAGFYLTPKMVPHQDVSFLTLPLCLPPQSHVPILTSHQSTLEIVSILLSQGGSCMLLWALFVTSSLWGCGL